MSERETSPGARVRGAVTPEIDVLAVWAWRDHSAASRHAQEALAPLKGYPGVIWARPRGKKARPEGLF